MTIFKTLSADDRVSTKTLLHEAIPITGTIVSGGYGVGNIKNFTHGMFQSVYDYPYLSSSANHIFDISFGVGTNSSIYNSSNTQAAKKTNIYNQMAQVLMGYDKDGNIQRFDEDGDLSGGGGVKIDNAMFLSFSRLLVKDEIKKGSFQMTIGTSASFSEDAAPGVFANTLTLSDVGASTSYRVNSPAGEYGILYATASSALLDTSSTHTASVGGVTYWRAGLIYYQAGVIALTSSMFMAAADGGYLIGNSCEWDSSANTLTGSLINSEISGAADGLRTRIQNIQFNNTIELNSTVYFCRAKHNEFNYSSNPTYLTNSQIRVKNQATDLPISYITSIGLYSADNTLLAVGKFSEPIRKDSNIELTFRARLDY